MKLLVCLMSFYIFLMPTKSIFAANVPWGHNFQQLEKPICFRQIDSAAQHIIFIADRCNETQVICIGKKFTSGTPEFILQNLNQLINSGSCVFGGDRY